MINAVFNELLRLGISALVAVVGWILECFFWLRVLDYRSTQARLACRYQIREDSALEPFSPELQQRLESLYQDCEQKGLSPRWVETSGSTATPKRLLYTSARIHERHWSFFESFARVLSRWGIFRRSFFVMASLAGAHNGDRSLTSAMLSGDKIPSRWICLQTPYRVQDHVEVWRLADRYGDVGLRLWLLVASQPGMLYSTNPSTLAAFVDAISGDWPKVRALCRDWVRDSSLFHPKVREAYQKIESTSAREILGWIAQQEQVSNVQAFFKKVLPKLQVVSTWDGGYVAPYLEKVKASFDVRFLPLYSMSSEVIETQPAVLGSPFVFGSHEVAFLPISRGVVFEFVSELTPDRVFKPWELTPGQEYVMVVSDPYGLKRYLTEDVFYCRGRVFGVPDLVFKRRQGLSYSFTGEKITADQVSLAIQSVRTHELWKGLLSAERGSVAPGFSVFPRSRPAPHYELVQIGGPVLDLDRKQQVIQIFEDALKTANAEFAAKRESQRLENTSLLRLEPQDFARRVAPSKRAEAWQSQFKFLPLYPQVESGES